MLRTLIENRAGVSAVVALGVWVTAYYRRPFPEDDLLAQVILAERASLFHAIRWTYITLWFTTPFIVCLSVLSLAYIFIMKRERPIVPGRLPRYPIAYDRAAPSVVVGEVHHARRQGPAEDPAWLTLPARGLYTGIAIVGAIGSGKTSGCMYPFADQILGHQRDDPARRIGGLVLEVKGDFCHKVRQILTAHGRAKDYLELSLDAPYCYNPLHNDLDAYAVAYSIASLLNNLYGKGKEPFWQQAYTNLVKFIVLLHRVLYDYVTLFDIYACAINPDLLEERLEEATAQFEPRDLLLVSPTAVVENPTLREAHGFVLDDVQHRLVAPWSAALARALTEAGIGFETQHEVGGPSAGPDTDRKREQLAAVRRWFEHDWQRIDQKLRTSIVEGISVFLSLFDDDPTVKRIFCPPKACYDPVANHDGRYGIPFPPLPELIERGAVCALNLPVAANPGLAKAIGTFLKQDFQRAVLNRIPQMAQTPDRPWREVLFLCDEYHAFATVGDSDPSGDEKFFALSREARCIPIVATQSVSSLRSTLPGEAWRTLLQTFRTKLFLTLSDDFSARVASDLCGRQEQLRQQHSISENALDARVSLFSGRTTAQKASVSATTSYTLHVEPVFEPKIFAELSNAMAIVLAYDGMNPIPPTFCYLKPHYADPNRTYFEQRARGVI